MALVLSVAVFALFPVAFTQQAQAASTKTYYVVTQSKTVWTTGQGGGDTYYTKYTYNKNGLTTSAKYTDGKVKYTRDSKGYITKAKSYDKSGKLQSTSVYTNKYNGKGLLKSSKVYDVKGKKKTLSYTAKYTYYSNKKLKKEVLKYADGGSGTYTYYKSGRMKSSTYKDADGKVSTTKYDKHGSMKSHKSADWTENHTVLKYDKKGNLIKDVYTSTSTFDGSSYTTKYEMTAKLTYDKHKNITKSVQTTKITQMDGSVATEKNTYTAKYKKVKVPKKYQHFFN